METSADDIPWTERNKKMRARLLGTNQTTQGKDDDDDEKEKKNKGKKRARAKARVDKIERDLGAPLVPADRASLERLEVSDTEEDEDNDDEAEKKTKRKSKKPRVVVKTRAQLAVAAAWKGAPHASQITTFARLEAMPSSSDAARDSKSSPLPPPPPPPAAAAAASTDEKKTPEGPQPLDASIVPDPPFTRSDFAEEYLTTNGRIVYEEANLRCELCPCIPVEFKRNQTIPEGCHQHTVCAPCLDAARDAVRKTDPTALLRRCPICPSSKAAPFWFVDLTLGDITRKLKVQCVFRDRKLSDDKPGCPWTNTLDDWVAHVNVCDYNAFRCNHCNLCFRGFDLDSHYAACPEKPVDCPDCDNTPLRKNLELHKTDDCHARILTCTECQQPCAARDMYDHEKQLCPELAGFCPWGCGQKVKRKDLPTHEQDSSVALVHFRALKVLKPLGCSQPPLPKANEVERETQSKATDDTKEQEQEEEKAVGAERESNTTNVVEAKLGVAEYDHTLPVVDRGRYQGEIAAYFRDLGPGFHLIDLNRDYCSRVRGSERETPMQHLLKIRRAYNLDVADLYKHWTEYTSSRGFVKTLWHHGPFDCRRLMDFHRWLGTQTLRSSRSEAAAAVAAGMSRHTGCSQCSSSPCLCHIWWGRTCNHGRGAPTGCPECRRQVLDAADAVDTV